MLKQEIDISKPVFKEFTGCRIVSEEKFLEIKTNFKNAESRYHVYLENRNRNGQKVSAKTTGYIHQIYVSEGEYINAGYRLLYPIS